MKKPDLKDVIFIAAVVVIAVCLIYSNVYFKGVKEKKEYDETKLVVGVHVKGEVKNAGYYELNYNSRVKDAIMCAGGETEKADINGINLAEFLVDGQEIIVPAAKDKKAAEEKTDGKININTADIYHLCKIKGVGEKLAGAIIDYRTKNGEFSKPEHLKRVKGIGASTFEEMKEYICVE